MLDSFYNRKILNRKREEELFTAALEEFRTGYIREGLMAKALSDCKGDESSAQASYIKLLAQAIGDDQYLEQKKYQQDQNINTTPIAPSQKLQRWEIILIIALACVLLIGAVLDN